MPMRGTAETRKVHLVKRYAGYGNTHDSAIGIPTRSQPPHRNQDGRMQIPAAIAPRVFKWMQGDGAESTKRVKRPLMADHMRKKRAIAETKLNKPINRVMGWRKVVSRTPGESQSPNVVLREKVTMKRMSFSNPVVVQRSSSQNVRSRYARNRRPVDVTHVSRKLPRDRADQCHGSSQLAGLIYGTPARPVA